VPMTDGQLSLATSDVPLINYPTGVFATSSVGRTKNEDPVF
jgi:hypothetical protein